MALGSVLLADGRLSSADTPSLAFADKVGADLLKLLHGVLDVRTIAIKLAAGKVVACPFSAEVIEAGRELVFSSLESAGSTLPVREVSEGQPFYLAAIEELLRMSGDPDYAAYDTAENSFAKGVRIGVGAELPRVPAVFEEKTGSRKYDDDAEHAQSERDNYLSARENAAEVQKQFLEEAALGAMVEVSLEEALAEYGDRLALASLGAIEKRDGTYRVVHDGTQGVGVNSSITVRDQLRSPTAGDLSPNEPNKHEPQLAAASLAALTVWYFCFLCVFVLLVTAIGSSIMATGQYLLQHPFDAPSLLARNMPQSTHFYLNFIPMQMAAYATAALRLSQLMKYMAFRTFHGPADAKVRSEPEDQTYFGIGSRSARASLHLVTVLTFCTLSPLISFLGLMMFAICLATQGFLFREVESVKSDSGGVFFVTSLRHVLQGLFIFVLLMTGVLAERSGNWIPGAVSASSLVFVQWSNNTFRRRYRWRHVQFEEILKMPETRNKRPSSGENYRQPELDE
ncbi:Uncharacterized protein RSN1 [Symbiodinium microadriaticum]|uniref:Uncharacterized protein RSN1 n=1 Tax=Symbiodinium microadriaticum TaxID=2951 RepID=A0A1Q9DK99_SYMMI|nr:Uncharacterized protein RSN1 [Symbiodinium microadriaticum]